MVEMPELEELYDDATLFRLGMGERRGRVESVAGAPAVALATALSIGMREAVAPERPVEEIIEEVDVAATQLRGDEAVRVVFVPHAPKATRAYVRRWA